MNSGNVKKIIGIIVLIAAFVLIFKLINFSKSPEGPPKKMSGNIELPNIRKKIYDFKPDQCPAGVADIKALDLGSSGFIESGETGQVELNWYKCHEIEVGDFVAYRYSEFHDPVIRLVVAVGGDKISTHVNEELGIWNLKINGKFYETFDGKLYSFGTSKADPPLKLFEDQTGGKLGPSQVVIMSTVSGGTRDSGIFGPSDISDIIGIVRKKEALKEPALEKGISK